MEQHSMAVLLMLIAAGSMSTLLLAGASPQSWEFAVTSRSKIIFFDEHWQEVTSSAHQFDHLSALTLDETEELLYFNDQHHHNGSIYSLKIPLSVGPHIIEKTVQLSGNETVRGIAYDPLNRNLFWSDSMQRKIYFRSIDAVGDAAQPQVLVDLANEENIPDGVAVDICRRKLYWTNSNFKNATVERVDLDGTNREVVVASDLYMPHGIVVDQLSDRIYWVNDQQGVHFSMESAKLDGSDRQVLVQGQNNVPLYLAVTKAAIYWTDQTHNAVWSYEKQAEAAPEPQKVASFADDVRGIVSRTHFYQTLQNDQHCADVVSKITERLLVPKVTRSPVDRQVEQLQREYCLNGGKYVVENGICICQQGYKGARCESSECHNFCVHGTCVISTMGFPKCYCQNGYYGERCQSAKCTGYCFNDGVCKVDSVSGDPSCECRDNFGGQRCEQNSTEICGLFCRILKHEPEAYVPFGCHDICEELVLRTDGGDDIYGIPRYQHLEVCQTASMWTSYVIITLVAGVVACLGLIALIVHGLRRIYKPARPRIKKTFVVRKQARSNSSSDTPLTNRPLATEQCEITIENCCNMNICETPCFDPKLVEQTLSARDTKATCGKEDKKILIHNMEDDLY